jgi:hypothetical protein
MNLRNIPNNFAFINNTSLLCLQDIDLLTVDEKDDIDNLLQDKLNNKINKPNSIDDNNKLNNEININHLNRQIDYKELLGNVNELVTIGCIAQISTLALFANDIFSNLIFETKITNDRIIKLKTKLTTLKDKIDNSDVEINLCNNHKSNHVNIDNQLILPSSSPLSIIQQYKLINKVFIYILDII